MNNDVSTVHPSRRNNFNIIRLIAALCVMSGHMTYIADVDTPSFAKVEIHNVGVIVLFLIGGYLVAKSWLSDPHPVRYAVKRFVRIWPPFAVFVLLMVYVAGPLLSELGPEAYFQNDYKSFLYNLRLYIVYRLPGVFPRDLPMTGVINGSLWTIPVEAALYVACPVILLICGWRATPEKRGYRIAVIAGVVLLGELIRSECFPTSRAIFYATDWLAGLYLIASFLIGMAFACLKTERLLNTQIAAVLMAAVAATTFNRGTQGTIAIVAIAYFVFSFALMEKPLFAGFARKYDLSYGIYLYGFFFQQLAAWTFNIQMNLSLTCMELFLVSLVPTLAAAWLSCVLVEQPLIRLTRWAFRRLDASKNRA